MFAQEYFGARQLDWVTLTPAWQAEVIEENHEEALILDRIR